MTIEQEFYKCFGIEPICPKGCTILGLTRNCNECEYADYPPITDRILLELICMYNNNVCECEKITPSDINTLRENVLHWIITDFEGNDEIKYQIQQLFKEYE